MDENNDKSRNRKTFLQQKVLSVYIGVNSWNAVNALELMKYYYINPNIHELYLRGHTEGFCLLGFILCVAGGGISFCIEQKGQCVRYITLRGNIGSYGIGKVVSAFVGGSLITFY